MGGGKVAGRYQGTHVISDQHGQSRRVEVFWQGDGWFWRQIIEDHQTLADPIGPFTKSTEAYESAKLALTAGSLFPSRDGIAR
jgi:hypothetical protein